MSVDRLRLRRLWCRASLEVAAFDFPITVILFLSSVVDVVRFAFVACAGVCGPPDCLLLRVYRAVCCVRRYHLPSLYVCPCVSLELLIVFGVEETRCGLPFVLDIGVIAYKSASRKVLAFFRCRVVEQAPLLFRN